MGLFCSKINIFSIIVNTPLGLGAIKLIIIVISSLFFLSGVFLNDILLASSCVTNKCHSDIGKDKFVHGPVAVGACSVCHIETTKHKFKAIENAGKLCYKCHDSKSTMSNIHPPVKEGLCTDCHSPHQSPFRYQLYNKPPKLCFRCHDEEMAKAEYVHGPVAVGGCVVCHNPHESNNPKMLMAKGNNVCYICHIDKLHMFKEKKFLHKPAKEACIKCHSPHTGKYRFNLQLDPNMELCLGCHTDKKESIKTVKYKHGALDTKKKCLACHNPHVADYPKQLIKQPMDLCLGCHDREYKQAGNKKIINMKAYLAKNTDHHGPIKQKDCTACHNPHGSNYFRMLRRFFPPIFYAPFNIKNYSLCFGCHEKTLVLDEFTTTLTGFRNGNMNLHYKHVNKKRKGRTCRACHEMHATNNPKHIRNAIPFGAWGLPIQHKKTKTGGKCTPGCHQTFLYDRDKPFKNR